MRPATQHFGASFLLNETRPDLVVTTEDLGEEEQMFMQAVTDFADREVRPHLDE